MNISTRTRSKSARIQLHSVLLIFTYTDIFICIVAKYSTDTLWIFEWNILKSQRVSKCFARLPACNPLTGYAKFRTNISFSFSNLYDKYLVESFCWQRRKTQKIDYIKHFLCSKRFRRWSRLTDNNMIKLFIHWNVNVLFL